MMGRRRESKIFKWRSIPAIEAKNCSSARAKKKMKKKKAKKMRNSPVEKFTASNNGDE